jgi:hypothetical protein
MNDSYLGIVWTEVQRAETMLFQSAFQTNIEDYRAMMTSLKGPPDSVAIMIRMVSGFNSQRIRVADYLQRYPFSSLEVITAELETCVEHELMTRKPNGEYAATEIGYNNVKTWMEYTGKIMSRLPLEGSLVDDAQTLVACDYRVVANMAKTASLEKYPILINRLHGLCPDYEPLQLWHHWQLVWTMLAAREDISWRVCLEKGMTPLAFFFHRQLWFRDRRPWRARRRLHTFKDLVALAERYSPLSGGVIACTDAIEQLTTQRWIDPGVKYFKLNETGLTAGDTVESAIDFEFLFLLPQLTREELETWHNAAQRLNAYFSGILENLK